MSDIYCYRDSFKSFDWNNSGRIGYRCLQVNKDAEKTNKQTNKQTYAESNAALKTLFNQSAMMSATHNKQTNKSECNEVGELAPDTQPNK